jgi:proteasome lid subunit RPN8/RPN11
MLTEIIKSQIKAHAISENPKECCGFIVLSNIYQIVLKCKNVSPKPEERFVISPEDYLRAQKAGKIQALYHSHTNDFFEFSEIDNP